MPMNKKSQNEKVDIDNKILVADDELVSRKILKKTLTSWGYEVILVDNGRDAWNKLKNRDIHMAVLDWIMPGMTGPEICRKVRRLQKDRYTYLILLTAKQSQEDTIKGLMEGADDFIKKPFNPAEMKARLLNGKRIIDLESQLLRTQKKLHDLATLDGMTKLWNRDTILQILEEEIIRSSRDGFPVGTIMIDIDNFKIINDTYGHLAGDAVLIETAVRLQNNVRRYDKVGRYGGDELFIILPNCHIPSLERISARIQKAIEEKLFQVPDAEIPVTISVGGSSSEFRSDITAETMISSSDHALLEAKKKGRNRFIIAKSR